MMNSPRLIRVGLAVWAALALLPALAWIVILDERAGLAVIAVAALLALPRNMPEWLRLVLLVAFMSVAGLAVSWFIDLRSDSDLQFDSWLAEDRFRLVRAWIVPAVIVFVYKLRVDDAEADRFR